MPGPGNVPQAPHLNVAVFGRGMLRQLCTRIYFAGDLANQNDPILALVPEERRPVARLRNQESTGEAGIGRPAAAQQSAG